MGAPLPAPPSQAAAAARVNRAEVMRLLAGRFAQRWNCPREKGTLAARGGAALPLRYRLRERVALAAYDRDGGRDGGGLGHTEHLQGRTRRASDGGTLCATLCGCCWGP